MYRSVEFMTMADIANYRCVVSDTNNMHTHAFHLGYFNNNVRLNSNTLCVRVFFSSFFLQMNSNTMSTCVLK